MLQFTEEQQLLGSVMHFLFLNDVIWMDIQCLGMMAQVPPLKERGTAPILHIKVSLLILRSTAQTVEIVVFGLEATNLKEKACVANWGVEFETCGCLAGRKVLMKTSTKLHCGNCRIQSSWSLTHTRLKVGVLWPLLHGF